MDIKTREQVIHFIINGEVEKGLKLLAEDYHVDIPKIKVGLPKGHRRKTSGCYHAKKQTIYVLNRDVLRNPSVILHEFYHHLRTLINQKHKGTEKYANTFADVFLNLN